jgi:manganese/zinc/iron transport system ATP- binding protein
MPLQLASVEGARPAPARGDEAPLAIRGLTVSYGQKPAVFSVDMTIRPGRMTAIIGPNGAGSVQPAGRARPDRQLR